MKFSVLIDNYAFLHQQSTYLELLQVAAYYLVFLRSIYNIIVENYYQLFTKLLSDDL